MSGFRNQIEVSYNEICESNEVLSLGGKTDFSTEHHKVEVLLKHSIGESQQAVGYRSLKF